MLKENQKKSENYQLPQSSISYGQQNKSIPGQYSNKIQWYTQNQKFWKLQPTSFTEINAQNQLQDKMDINFSLQFFSALKSQREIGKAKALDVGAGVGRISKLILSDTFSKIHIIEQSQNFIDEATKNISSEVLEKVYHSKIQDTKLEGKYDCIWIQYVLCNLPDEEIVKLLIQGKNHLAPKGVIIMKQDVSNTQKSSIYKTTQKKYVQLFRPLKAFYQIFQKANLRVIREVQQFGLPEEFEKIYMFALE